MAAAFDFSLFFHYFAKLILAVFAAEPVAIINKAFSFLLLHPADWISFSE